MCMLLVASERLEHTNRSALRCSFYLEHKIYRFFGCSPLPREAWAEKAQLSLLCKYCAAKMYLFSNTGMCLVIVVPMSI